MKKDVRKVLTKGKLGLAILIKKKRSAKTTRKLRENICKLYIWYGTLYPEYAKTPKTQ